MNRDRRTLIGMYVVPLTVAALAIGLLVLLVTRAGCGDAIAHENATKRITRRDISTVEHDGHWFVLYDGYHQGGIIHHPDCPKCAEKGRVEP